MATNKKLRLSQLLVNTENYRFEVVSNQKEAINKMIEDQNDNLYSLAEHIQENGLNPSDKIATVISNHDKSKYIVLEGNRRTVSLKILNNPDLIEDPKFSKLKTKFNKLKEKYKNSLVSDVDCLIYDNPKDAEVWIGLKHGYGGNGILTETWGPLQKQRFGEMTDGKTSTSLQVINLLNKSKDVPTNIKNELQQISTTNLDRLINDPDVRNFLGIEINEGIIQSKIDESEIIKGLTQVVKDILKPDFNVKKIYNKDDRKDYMENFPKTKRPDLTKRSDKPWSFTANTPTTTLSTPSSTRNTTKLKDRKTLIPKSCNLNITNEKVKAISQELKKLDTTVYTNAAAVLFRVFIELSTDTYLEENKLVPTGLSAAKCGWNLQTKINKVAEHLNNKKLSDEAISKAIKTAVKDSNNVLGLETWHAYVHNNRFSPSSSTLILTWNNIEKFMVTLWSNIK